MSQNLIPTFTPVPRQRMRRGGWSAERQRAFIDLLAETGSVRAACRRMGVGEHHIYKLRAHPEAASFRKAWEAALDLGIARIEDVAMDRALNGVETPVYQRGELVGTRRVYNDRLLMFLLRNRAPDRFGAGTDGRRPNARGAIGMMQVERLKKQWRAEWEAERRSVTPQQVRASIDRKVDELRQQHERQREREWAQMSEETRTAWEHFVALRDRDLDARGADEDIRRMLREGPRETVNALPPPPKEPPTPAPPKTMWKLTDEDFGKP